MSYWDDVTPNSVASAPDVFKEFKEGDNVAFVKTVEEKFSSNGNPMLVITFENEEGAEIKHFIVDGEYKLQKLKQFYIAFGIPLGSRNSQEWRGKRGIVVCKKGEPYNGVVFNKVNYLRPIPISSNNAKPANNPSRTQPSQMVNPLSSLSKYGPYGEEDPGQSPSPFDDEFTDDIPF